MVLPIKKAWWSAAIIVLAICLWVAPASAKLAPIDPRDPYISQSAKFFLDLKNEYKIREYGSTVVDQDIYTQKYKLELKGNIIDPRLIIWGITVKHGHQTTSTNGNEGREVNSWSYLFDTTIFRRLKFPLSIFFRRDTEDTVGTTARRSKDEYGFQWFFRFDRLPETTLTVKRSVDNETSASSMNYDLLLTKETARTSSKARLNHAKSDNSKRSTLNTNTNYQISNRTRASAGFVYSSISTTADKSTAIGLNMSATARPSRYINHSHLYTFVMSDASLSETIFSKYLGSLHYTPGGRFSASAKIDHLHVENDSSTSQLKEVRTLLRTYAQHNLTTRHTFKQKFNYSFTEAADVSLVTSESSREKIELISALYYRRPLSWATITSNFGIGLDMVRVEPSSQDSLRLAQNAKLTLSNIPLKYIKLTTGVWSNRRDNISGNAWEHIMGYRLNASNTLLRKYVILGFGYSYKDARFSTPGRNYTAESYTIVTKLNNLGAARGAGANEKWIFFRRISLDVIVDYDISTSFNPQTKTSSTTHHLLYGYDLGYSKKVMTGRINAKMKYRYDLVKTTFTENKKQKYTYLLSFKKRIARNGSWRITLKREKDLYGDYERTTTTTELENKFIFRYRAWNINADHTFKLVENNYNEEPKKESILMLRARRMIGRKFFFNF